MEKLFSSLRDAFLAERLRWPLWAPVLAGLGILLYFRLPVEPPLPVALAATAGFVMAAVKGRGRLLPLLLFSALAAASAGFSAASIRAHAVAAPVLFREVGPRMLEGSVEETSLYPDALVAVLGDVSVERLEAEKTPKRVRLRFAGKKPPQLPVGAHIRVLAMLQPPQEPAWPGAYDSQFVAWFRGLGASGFALGVPEILENGSPAWLMGFRTRLSARIKEIAPGPAGQLTDAVLTGNAAVIGEDVLAAMRDSGLAHLIAISGMNIGIVAGFVFILIRRLLAFFPAIALRHPIKKWAALPAFLAAAAYTILAGAPVPAMRSLLMTGLVLLGVVIDRAALSMNLAAAAAAIILILRPESLVGASFQLSFAAVIALIAAFELFRKTPGGKGIAAHVLRHVGGVAFSSVVAGLATLPFALFHFQRAALYGVLANMLAVPLTTFVVMPAGFLGMLLFPLGLDRPFFAIAAWGNGLIVADAQAVAAWPGAAWNMPPLSPACLAVFCAGGLWLALMRGRGRHAGWLGIAASLALAFSPPAMPDVFISGDGERVAVVEGDTLYTSSRKTDSYAADSWRRRAGAGTAASFPNAGGEKGPVRCDHAGCIARVKGHVLAFPRIPEALMEDCARAELVIVPWNIGKTCAAQVIGLADFRKMGSHMLRWDEDGALETTTDIGVRGRRPWTGRGS